MPSNFYGILGTKREAAKIVLKVQNFEQKQRHIDIAQEDGVQRRSRFAQIFTTGY